MRSILIPLFYLLPTLQHLLHHYSSNLMCNHAIFTHDLTVLLHEVQIQCLLSLLKCELPMPQSTVLLWMIFLEHLRSSLWCQKGEKCMYVSMHLGALTFLIIFGDLFKNASNCQTAWTTKMTQNDCDIWHCRKNVHTHVTPQKCGPRDSTRGG